jgi:hypothetical protein
VAEVGQDGHTHAALKKVLQGTSRSSVWHQPQPFLPSVAAGEVIEEGLYI